VRVDASHAQPVSEVHWSLAGGENGELSSLLVLGVASDQVDAAGEAAAEDSDPWEVVAWEEDASEAGAEEGCGAEVESPEPGLIAGPKLEKIA